MFNWVRGVMAKVENAGNRAVFAALLAAGTVVSLFGGQVMAADITIPDMPVDFADIATKGAVILGTVVAGVMGIFVIVSLINMGIKWVKRAFAS